MAPREGRSGGHRPPARGERLHEGEDRAPRDPAGAALRGDPGAHEGDRPQRADVARATGGTTRAPSRASSTASTAACRSPRPDDWEPPVLPEARVGPGCRAAAIPGEQVLLDDNARGRGPRVLLARQLRHHRRRVDHALRRRPRGRRAVHDPAARDRRHRPRLRRRHRGHRGRRRVRPERALPLLCDRRRVLAPRHDLAARGRQPRHPTTSRSSTNPTSGSGSASASRAAAGSS